MAQQTSLFRTSKTRNSRSQQQLKSTLLAQKHSAYTKISNEEQYHQSYTIPLPATSVELLQPLLDGLTGEHQPIDVERRSLYTIGVWRERSEVVYRCCFVQPEIASATCSFAKSWRPTVEYAIEQVCEAIPYATKCSLSSAARSPQISGRLAPYVVDSLPFKVTWGFANICKSYFLFIVTDMDGPHLMSLSSQCMEILRPYFPEYSICVCDSTTAFKITVTPEPSSNANEPNKNSCMYVYGDGSFRYQGHPSAMKRVCKSFRDAIMSISESKVWHNFVGRLNLVPQDDDVEES